MAQFSQSQRKKLASSGKALPDGSFPIKNASDLSNARQAIGRTSPGKRPAVKALVRKRASELGVKIPSSSAFAPKGKGKSRSTKKKGS